MKKTVKSRVSKEDLQKLVDKGLNQEQMSKALGCCDIIVRHLLKDYGFRTFKQKCYDDYSIGTKIEKLTILELIVIKNIKWYKCKCECGKEKLIRKTTIRKGQQSCGCACIKRKLLLDKDTLIRFISDGLPVERIAAILKVGRDFVTKNLKIYGLQSSGQESRTRDIIGERYGKLKVLEYIGVIKNRGRRYKCVCDCGKTKIIAKESLIKGDTRSCGCLVNRKRDAYIASKVGEKYNRLLITGYKKSKWSEDGRTVYACICKCDCGNAVEAPYRMVKNGKYISCGCLRDELASIRGSKYGKEYCYNAAKVKWYFKVNGEKINCRSGYEVLYANYLIKNNIQFLYEPETFKIKEGRRYTPDFYLPEKDTYIEIKGFDSNPNQIESREIFSRTHKLETIRWENLKEICKFPLKSYCPTNDARKLGVSPEDYLANEIYLTKI